MWRRYVKFTSQLNQSPGSSNGQGASGTWRAKVTKVCVAEEEREREGKGKEEEDAWREKGGAGEEGVWWRMKWRKKGREEEERERQEKGREGREKRIARRKKEGKGRA